MPLRYQNFLAVPATMSRTSNDWNLTADGMELFASATASTSVAPEYGPDHESTGTGLTGFIPNGS